MSEEPKRLAPTVEVARELYLRSGNECAFPGCGHRIVDSEGTLIAELCHIKGALTGSARFDPAQSNEERRNFSNLLLMCHAHHKITDNEAEFPVERLREIKALHEAKFSRVIDRIREQIVDLTGLDVARPARSLDRMNDVNEMRLSREQLDECARELGEFAARLNRIPREVRELLVVMASRRIPGRGVGGSGDKVALRDIEIVTGRSSDYLVGLVDLLERHDFISSVWEDDRGLPITDLLDLESGWRIWDELSQFCEATGTPMTELIVELRFDRLD